MHVQENVIDSADGSSHFEPKSGRFYPNFCMRVGSASSHLYRRNMRQITSSRIDQFLRRIRLYEANRVRLAVGKQAKCRKFLGAETRVATVKANGERVARLSG